MFVSHSDLFMAIIAHKTLDCTTLPPILPLPSHLFNRIFTWELSEELQQIVFGRTRLIFEQFSLITTRMGTLQAN